MNFQKVVNALNKNADIITAGMAVVGLITTVVLAIKETPKAETIVEESAKRIDDIHWKANDEKWPVAEENKEVNIERLHCLGALIFNYGPTIVSFTITGACIIGTNRISRRNYSILAGTLNATNLMFQEYKDRAREVLPNKEFQELDDGFEKARLVKRLENHDMPAPSVREVYHTGFGEKLYSIDTVPGDPSTRIYFRSSPEAVTKAEMDFNAAMLYESGDNAGVYADYLYYLGIKDAIKYKTAMNYYHFMENAQDFVHARLREYEEHPTFLETWCHIDFDPTDWKI